MPAGSLAGGAKDLSVAALFAGLGLYRTGLTPSAAESTGLGVLFRENLRVKSVLEGITELLICRQPFVVQKDITGSRTVSQIYDPCRDDHSQNYPDDQ